MGLAKGREPPDWYKAEPPRSPVDDFYMSAFWSLSTCRQMGFSPGPIPWNHVKEYAEYAGLDRENAFALEVIIRAMDEAYLDDCAKRQERETQLRSARPAAKAN